MTQDYPDWTNMVNIIGTDIMIAMDIQGSMIMVPVDIQAQYVDLDINIKAQEVTLDINIAATAVTLDVNLKAQDVTINIDIEAQSVGIYLQPEWAALQLVDKNFHATAGSKGYNDGPVETYEVPNGKTLYICGFSCEMHAYDAANYDHFLYFQGAILNFSGGDPRAIIGGIGGGSVVLSKPMAYSSDVGFQLVMTNYSNISCNMYIDAWGYEI